MSIPDPFLLLAGDAQDDRLVENVHPRGWANPDPAPSYNLVVLGAGTAGLVAAVGGVTLGARVALVEKGLLGGDCLNFGCVPSKALIRSARAAADVRTAADFGVKVGGAVEVDFEAVMKRVRHMRARLSGNDSAARMMSLGIDVFLGEGRFLDRRRLEVGGRVLKFAKAVVATGTRPAIPAIPGLVEAGFLTNESVFTLTRRPVSLAVIGGGPIGCELAQAFARLGTSVILIQRAPRLLPREDRDASELLGRIFRREGIQFHLNAGVTKVEMRDGKKILHWAVDGRQEAAEVCEVLVGAGRVPNVEGLGLEKAGVSVDAANAIKVDRYLRTSNKRIFAAGDVCFPEKYTHMAEATARIAVQNALFIRSKSTRSLKIPRCIFTDPEIARVGLTEDEARAGGKEIRMFKRSLAEIDRAVVDGEEEGFAKILIRKRRPTILGAMIVARHAGEMISEVTAMAAAGKGVGFLGASVIHPYPTQSEAIKRTASLYFMDFLKPRLGKVLKLWFAWKR